MGRLVIGALGTSTGEAVLATIILLPSIVGFVALCGAIVAWRIGKRRENRRGSPPLDDEQELVQQLRQAAQRQATEHDGYTQPEVLEQDSSFRDSVRSLEQPEVPLSTLMQLSRDSNEFVACVALAAIAGRSDPVPPEFIEQRASTPRRPRPSAVRWVSDP